jgi:hypothetical protein
VSLSAFVPKHRSSKKRETLPNFGFRDAWVEPEVEDEPEERWLGNRKVFQVIYERGMLDPEKYEAGFYGVSGKKDKDDVAIPGSSFKELLASCAQISKNELSLMYLGVALGVHITSTPSIMQRLRVRESNMTGRYRRTGSNAARHGKPGAGFATQVKKALSSEITTKARVDRQAGKILPFWHTIWDEQQK